MSTYIKSELLLTSINSITGDILYTFKFVYPRMLLAETNTHRMFSRNTSSSRAIPNKKQRLRVWNDPFVPTSIGSKQAGMQAGEELSGLRRSLALLVWKGARVPNILAASILDRLGVHKQLSNRLIEPHTWTEQLVTATDWENFIKLRAHEAAEPHMQELAYQVKEQIEHVKSVAEAFGCRPPSDKPFHWVHSHKEGVGKIQILKPREWHLPFVSATEQSTMVLDLAKKVSAARCARVSYSMPDTGKKSSVEEDIKLFDRLTSGGHWSPLEHQATPMLRSEYSANFRGWQQFRKEFANEHGGDR